MTALYVACFLTGVWCVYMTARLMGLGHASTTWPATTGRVTASRFDWVTVGGRHSRRRRTVQLVLRYQYRVRGMNFGGCLLDFSGLSVQGGAARDAQNRYPEGPSVTVHYDPDEPGMAVLEPGVCAMPVIGFIACFLVPGLILHRIRHPVWNVG